MYQNCVDVNKAFPVGTVPNDQLPPERRLSWYVGSFHCLFSQEWLIINLDEPWDSRENLRPRIGFWQDAPDDLRQMDLRFLSLAQCPAYSGSRDENPAVASYVGIAGIGQDAPIRSSSHTNSGVWGHDRATRTDEVLDGLSSTVLLAETTRQNGPWIAGGHSTVRGITSARPLIGSGGQFGGLHASGCNALFADMSVKFLNESIDYDTLAALCTIAGHERLSGEGARNVTDVMGH